MNTESNAFVGKIKAKPYKALPFAIIAGSLNVCPFFDGRLFFLSYPGLIIFFLFLFALYESENKKGRFLYKFVFGFSFFCPLYSFLGQLYPFEGFGMSKGFAVLTLFAAVVLIPAVHSLLFSAVFALLKFFDIKKHKAFLPLYAGALWVIFEYSTSLGQLSFPWPRLAVGQYLFLPGIQTASLFSAAFVAAVMTCGCAYISLFVMCADKKKYSVIGICILAFNILAGSIILAVNSGASRNKGEKTKVALIQPNVLYTDKWNGQSSDEIYRKCLSLATDAAKSGAKLIVFPESSLPYSFTQGGGMHFEFAKIAKEYDTTFLLGVLYRDGEELYNSALAVYPDGSVSERYDKRHLVPFGEYLPYARVLTKLFPFLADLNLGDTDYISGKSEAVIDIKDMKLGVMICYDSIYGDCARNQVKNGANVLAMITNDSWFGTSAALTQHVAHTVLRCVENNKFAARAANSGISCFVDNTGKIIDKTEPMTQCILFGEISENESRTLFSYIGDVITPACALFVLLNIGIYLLRFVQRFIKERKK